MQPKFTDGHKYPRGYVRSESTDVSRTWAAARARQEALKRALEGKVRPLMRFAAVRVECA